MTKKFTLEFDEVQLAHLGTAIGELPFKIANPLIVELQKQIGEQQAKSEPKEVKEFKDHKKTKEATGD